MKTRTTQIRSNMNANERNCKATKKMVFPYFLKSGMHNEVRDKKTVKVLKK